MSNLTAAPFSYEDAVFAMFEQDMAPPVYGNGPDAPPAWRVAQVMAETDGLDADGE